MARRWTSEHVPVMIEPGDYQEVAAEMERALAVAGWKTRREPIHWMIGLPTRVLTLFTGSMAGKLIGEELITLTARNFEIMVHPSDLVINGGPAEVTHIRATLMEQLAFSRAYLTWSKDANAIEDRLRRIWDQLRAQSNGEAPHGAVRELRELERDLRALEVPYDEWQVLNRCKLLVERGMLQVEAGIAASPPEPTDTPPESIGAAQIAEAQHARVGLLGRIGTGAALAVLGWMGIQGARSTRR